MLKSSCLATIIVVGSSFGAFAQSRTTNSWIESFSVSPFEKMEMTVATATDKQTGRKFNVVKLPNGKMMVLTSQDKFQTLSPFSDDSEMMYGGHTGTTR